MRHTIRSTQTQLAEDLGIARGEVSTTTRCDNVRLSTAPTSSKPPVDRDGSRRSMTRPRSSSPSAISPLLNEFDHVRSTEMHERFGSTSLRYSDPPLRTV